MLAYVMNLDRSPERMARMSRLLDHLGIPYVRVAAVDGGQLTPPDGVSNGHYGNFLSHMKCWEMVAAGSEPAGLLLEDDVVFSRNVRKLLADKRLLRLADIVRLEGSNKLSVGRRKASLSGGYDACPLLSPAIGTAAYIVTRAGAEWLLANARPVRNIDQVVFDDLLHKGTEILTLVPSPCMQYPMVKGLPANPSVVSPTMPGADAAWEPPSRRMMTRIEVAAMRILLRVQAALYGRAMVRPTLHPSGPLTV